MKSGEFAAFCATTKETLRHYRAIGLFEPAAVSEAGYALYATWQWADFALIESLQDSGCSLAQIKRYLASPNAQELEGILSERIGAIEKERRRLLGRQRLLEGTLRRLGALDGWRREPGPFRLEHRGRSCLKGIVPLPLSYGEVGTPQLIDHVHALAELYRATIEDGTAAELQLVYRIDKTCLTMGEPRGDVLVCAPCDDGQGDVVRPAGTYLAWLHSYAVDDEPESDAEAVASYEPIIQELERRGLCARGDFYETELSLYSGNAHETLYSEVSVLVEEDEG